MRRLHFALSVSALATSLVATPAVADDDWTVLTMAPDGSWGAATSISINRAIAAAIANCKMEYQREIGCGAFFTSIQAGWSLGIRCGRENIVVAEPRRWLAQNKPHAPARWNYGGSTCATCRHASAWSPSIPRG